MNSDLVATAYIISFLPFNHRPSSFDRTSEKAKARKGQVELMRINLICHFYNRYKNAF